MANLRVRFASIFAGICLAALAYCVDPIEMRARPLWESLTPGKSRCPLYVTVFNNTGRDAVGQIVFDGKSATDVIPVEVGRNSSKEIPIYPQFEVEPLEIRYQSNVGSKYIRYRLTTGFANQFVGYIGDGSGDLNFLRHRIQANGSIIVDETVTVGYCAPEDAPTRPVGLSCLDAVFLGEGSERLNERQVEALLQYANQGGRIILGGGANVPQLASPAWKKVLPISFAAPRTFANGVTITMANGRTKINVREPITLMLGKKTPSALVASKNGNETIGAVRPVGMGAVVLLGFNPFAEPMSGHPNRRQLVVDAMKVAMYGTRSTIVHSAMLDSSRMHLNDDQYQYYTPQMGEAPTLEALYFHKSAAWTNQGTNSPFNVTLIPASTVGWVFLCFFVAVVPLNFIVLRIAKKMEWAWVTTPIICFVFAAVLLNASSGLYSAKMSKSFDGFVVQDLDAGLSSQWLLASYFLPRGGSYDLSLDKTDQVVESSQFDQDQYDYMYRYSDPMSRNEFTPTAVDMGTVTIPDVGVPNLAFREIAYNRVGTEPLPVSLKVRRTGNTHSATITNKTKTNMTRVSLLVDGFTYTLTDVAPGATISINKQTQKDKIQTGSFCAAKSPGTATLYAIMRDFDAGGPGELAKTSTRVLLICTKEVEGAP